MNEKLFINDKAVVHHTVKDRKFRIGWSILLVFALMQLPLGLSIATGYLGETWQWHRDALLKLGFANQPIPVEIGGPLKALSGILGATMLAWGVMLCFLVAIPLRRREPWAFWCILLSFSSWWLLDTYLSASIGFWWNVAFNTGAAIMVFPALYLTRS